MAVKRHDEKYDQRFQVSAAEPQQRAEATGADKRHPKAEEQAADDGSAPFDPSGGVDRPRQIEIAGAFECMDPCYGDRRRQHPGPNSAHVPAVNSVLDGA